MNDAGQSVMPNCGGPDSGKPNFGGLALTEPVFAEPWQARAFALVLQLHGQGLFSWPEWAQALATQIAAAQSAGDPDRGDTYYQHWMAALEQLVTEKGASSANELDHHRAAWGHAAGRTPHGQTITLRAEDF